MFGERGACEPPTGRQGSPGSRDEVNRCVLRPGPLDGRAGAHFHVLQGFRYRHLVDAKVDEVERRMRDGGVDAVTAIHEVPGLDVEGRGR